MQADYLGLHVSNRLVTNLPIWLIQSNLTYIDLEESQFFLKTFRSTLKSSQFSE